MHLGDFLADPEATVNAARTVEAKRQYEIFLGDSFGLLWHGCHMPPTTSDGSAWYLGGDPGLYQAASHQTFEKTTSSVGDANLRDAHNGTCQGWAENAGYIRNKNDRLWGKARGVN
jgi:hypothetical protein